MKKIIVFIVLSTTLGVPLQAQDTLWMRPGPLSNYYPSQNWIDTTVRYACSPLFVMGSTTTARQFVTPDSLQVYGIAAMMVRDGFDFFFYDHSRTPADLQAYLESHYPDDPTYDNCEESLVLYQYRGGDSLPMQQLGDSLPVHALNTPVSYYIMSHPPILSSYDTFPKPIYERYFSVPQTVHDTFYAGFTQALEYDKEHQTVIFMRPYFTCMNFTSAYGVIDYEAAEAVYIGGWDTVPGSWDFFSSAHGDFFIFPIIAPPDTTNPGDTVVNPIDTVVTPADTLVILPGDTIVIGGDTLVNTGDTLVIISGEPFVIDGDTLVVNTGDTVIIIHGSNPLSISQPDLIYRYTSLQPNPATQRVTVTSSFGISRIEAYDTRGRRIFETHASGLKADLDISSWPRGTYLLRITTPAGSTTKKLLVQ